MAVTVAVIVPARDAVATVAAAVASIRAQPHTALELVVVDDASSDATGAVAAAAGADRVVRLDRRRGPAGARNVGVAASQSEIVAFLDADDVWVPDRLPRLLARLTELGVGGVVGACRFVGLGEAEVDHLGWEVGADRSAVVPSLGAAVFHRAELARVGPLDEELPRYEDYDWFLRLGDAGVPVATLREVVTEVRADSGSLSRRLPGDAGATLREVLRRAARRRRESMASPDVLRPRWGPVPSERGAEL